MSVSPDFVKLDQFLGYSMEARGIRVTVLPEHISESSAPEDDIFAFAYTVTIENMSPDTVQLLERHWLIMSGGAQLAEIVGPGVLGEQPELEVGEIYEYTSTAVIHDPNGYMEGAYTFRAEDGTFFEVPIPRFDLNYPTMIH